ncbi:hypothetical protein SK066_04015 [Paenibacillus hunanensis]|uniref:hypothetical protein n=1 Tax=Paenibacillus hunanensis TaxID=539262 RepID=UPI002A6B5C6C|nr:hypothetical protein [Paenibacillus hunanensis]WPP42131.1 hypothetical protein SK066_04015 [Paenibacillus hunanensis]
MLDKVHGAHANVFIQYEGSFQDLGLAIEKGVNITTLRFENMEEEPYDEVGYAEVLGFEIELKPNNKWPNYKYSMSITTTDSFQEIFNNRMFDISLWLARYLSLVCELTTMVENSDGQTGQLFYWNSTTEKRESSFVNIQI